MPQKTKPSKEELERRRLVVVNAETVSNVTSTDFPGHWPGEDHSWSLSNFKKAFKVEFYKNDPLDAQFDLIGIDTSIANAFRRILIAEVPTIAIEYVFVTNNTSIIQDEVLSHRLGLIPLKGDKEAIKKMSWFKKPPPGEAPTPTEDDTIVLQLKVACEKNPSAARDETDPNKLFINSSVFAKDIEFRPTGLQRQWFKNHPIEPVNPDILVAKLRPNQEIDLKMHCCKGIGKDHAKFSPVATASYRLLPVIKIKEPITGDLAEKFVKCFPKGVAEVVTGRNGLKEARVVNARNDTVSREVLRHNEFQGKVELGRIRDHFIFSVESTGMYNSDELFLQSVQVLKEKCLRIKSKLNAME